MGGGVVGDDERLAHEGVEVPEHVNHVATRGDGVNARQFESAGEHQSDAEQLALVVGQQIVRRRHRMTQRVLALGARRRPWQQAEPVGERAAGPERACAAPAETGFGAG